MNPMNRNMGKSAASILKIAMICCGVLLSPLVAIWIIVGPIHDIRGRFNTDYSTRFSTERYERIHIGMGRDTLLDLIGPPLRKEGPFETSAWAFRDESVRQKYDRNTTIRTESLYFSKPRKGGDYDLVLVSIGPNDEVIGYERWVTD